jgi:phosphoribosyl 1,2-cyclic phosphate phosphodiesterase
VSALRVTFLGTGTSHGVPAIGCDCPTCRSDDPRDRRWRPSILVETPDHLFALVDTSPDLRSQALAWRVNRVDAILFTHAHADHVLGLDDVRRYNEMQGRPMPCYGDADTVAEVRRTFAYVFRPPLEGGGVPRLRLFPIGGAFCLGHVECHPVPVFHGRQRILGYRFGDFAYLTDCSRIPDESWPLLAGVRVLALDALRDRPHPTHFTLTEALQVVDRLRPHETWLTHICHDLPHGATEARLPSGVGLAYDGLTVEIGEGGQDRGSACQCRPPSR